MGSRRVSGGGCAGLALVGEAHMRVRWFVFVGMGKQEEVLYLFLCCVAK